MTWTIWTGEFRESIARISVGHVIRDFAPVIDVRNCDEELAACRLDGEAALRDLGLCQGALQSCQSDLAQALDAIQALQGQLAQAQQQSADLRAVLTAIGHLLDQIEQDFQIVFDQPDFRISGANDLERFENLTAAILVLNRGGKTALFNSLGGSRR